MLRRVAGTIVVGFDGSDASGRALDRAIGMAASGAGRLVVVVVVPLTFDPLAPTSVGAWVLGPVAASEEELERDLAANTPPPVLQPVVAEAEKRAAAAGLEPEVAWRMGDPVREILDTARDSGASTIVLGEHHHRMFGEVLGDDVDAAVQREARCELVLVP